MTENTKCTHCGAKKYTNSMFECGTWAGGADRWKHCYEREIAQLKAERDALAKDKRRLDHVEAAKTGLCAVKDGSSKVTWAFGPGPLVEFDTPREAIDNAPKGAE